MYTFKFVRSCQIVLESDYTNTYSDGQCIRVPIFHILANICYCQPINMLANLMVSHYGFNTHFSDF